jgi:hypothetical protein
MAGELAPQIESMDKMQVKVCELLAPCSPAFLRIDK